MPVKKTSFKFLGSVIPLWKARYVYFHILNQIHGHMLMERKKAIRTDHFFSIFCLFLDIVSVTRK